MPKVTAEDAPHASFTDHKIRVVRDDEIQAVGGDGALVPYYDRDEGDSDIAGIAYIIYARQGGGSNAFRRGVSVLEAALAKRPEAGEGQFVLGVARLQMGNPREALAPLRLAVAAAENPERLNALAQALEQTSQASEAERFYRQALSIQPAAADIRTNLGRLLEAGGRLPEAIGAYRAAIEEEPWLSEAHVLLGGALAKSGDVGGATAALREAVHLEPDQPDALTNLGVLLAQQGDIGQAGRLFRRAVQAGPRNADALANLALYQINQGQLQEAQANARAALQVNPAQGTAQQVLQALSGG